MKIKSKVYQGAILYPFVRLSEGLEIPSYFLVISLVLCLGLFWIVRRGDRSQLPQGQVLDLSLWLMVSGVVGARAMHVLYENFAYYKGHPWRVFYFWEGGFVYYGGMIAAFLAAVVYLRLRVPASLRGRYFDAFAPVLSFVSGFGRIGCFLAGCCYGESCEYPWAVHQRHPTQLYALFWETAVIFFLLGVERTPPSQRPALLRRPGDLFLLWLALHALGRMIMESFRGDFRGNLIWGFSVSTVLSSLLLLSSVIFLGIRGRRL